MRSVYLAATLLVIAFGCDNAPSTSPRSAGPTANLEFRDGSGAVVATAEVDFPITPPASGSFQGGWRLTSAKPAFPSGATKTGSYSADVQPTGISVNLNPGMADDNVSLFGTMSDGSYRGTWYYETDAGGQTMGSFAVTRPSGDVR